MTTQLPADPGHGLQGGLAGAAVRADGHAKGIKNNVFSGNSVVFRGFQDFFRNFKAAFGGCRNAVFVQRQRHHHAAVFLHQREDGGHAAFLAAQGIDQRLAVIPPQGGFHRNRVRRVDLQRKIDDLLQGCDSLRQNLRLVDAGQAHIHIQNVHLFLLLGHALGEDIVQIPLQNGGLQPLLAGGIDPLADEPRFFAKFYGVGVGRHHRQAFIRGVLRADGGGFRRQGGDMRRGGAAAAANHTQALFHPLCQLRGKLRRGHIEHGPAVFRMGQAGIGLQHHGHGGIFQQFLRNTRQLRRAKGAVCAQRVHAQPLQQGHHSGRGRAGHQLAVGAIGIGDNDGQAAVFLGGQYGSLGFVSVVHGLDEDEIHAAICANTHRLGKDRHRILKIQVAVGFQELSRRADIQRHEFFLGRSG